MQCYLQRVAAMSGVADEGEEPDIDEEFLDADVPEDHLHHDGTVRYCYTLAIDQVRYMMRGNMSFFIFYFR